MAKIELLLGDCMELMKQLDSSGKETRVVITDPPYGINIGKMGFTNNRVGGVAVRNDYKNMGNWDERPISEQEISELFRLSRDQVIFGGQYIAHLLPPRGCWIVWDKKTEDKYTNDFSDCELAWTSSNKPSRMIRHLWHGMVQENMKHKEFRFHPTQKPVAVMKRIIELFTEDGDTVVDPYMGSGSTALACIELNRDFIGMEIDPTHFRNAKSRIAQARADLGEIDRPLAGNLVQQAAF